MGLPAQVGNRIHPGRTDRPFDVDQIVGPVELHGLDVALTEGDRHQLFHGVATRRETQRQEERGGD